MLNTIGQVCHAIDVYSRLKLPEEERVCKFCNNCQVEDEYHFLLQCNLYCEERAKLFTDICEICPPFDSKDIEQKFEFIINYNNDDFEVCTLVNQYMGLPCKQAMLAQHSLWVTKYH